MLYIVFAVSAGYVAGYGGQVVIDHIFFADVYWRQRRNRTNFKRPFSLPCVA